MASNISRRVFFGVRREPVVQPIPPPGTTKDSLLNCSGCGNCVDACPTHIIGLAGNRPSLDFSDDACVFCGECATVCPEQVFQIASQHRFPHVALITDSCLASNRVECQSCRDICPEQAIHFYPQAGGPFLPVLADDACNGCGACISVCPVTAIKLRELTPEAMNA